MQILRNYVGLYVRQSDFLAADDTIRRAAVGFSVSSDSSDETLDSVTSSLARSFVRTVYTSRCLQPTSAAECPVFYAYRRRAGLDGEEDERPPRWWSGGPNRSSRDGSSDVIGLGACAPRGYQIARAGRISTLRTARGCLRIFVPMTIAAAASAAAAARVVVTITRRLLRSDQIERRLRYRRSSECRADQ